jgi:hypothetical protein
VHLSVTSNSCLAVYCMPCLEREINICICICICMMVTIQRLTLCCLSGRTFFAWGWIVHLPVAEKSTWLPIPNHLAIFRAVANINMDTCVAGPILVAKASPVLKVNKRTVSELSQNVLLLHSLLTFCPQGVDFFSLYNSRIFYANICTNAVPQRAGSWYCV